ncbi:MAG: papain-like cysteine protease family protein, partial [Prosthecobacter sp.]|nr:papain-like cysteine protease family protein [Prosthecobacter sp.]
MPRRSSLPTLRSSLAALTLAALTLPVQAEEKCSARDSHGVSVCEAGLPAAAVRQLAVVQEQSQWCWAASIQMIFAHHGFKVPQQEIVKDGYGLVTNKPAPSGEAMTRALSRPWIDQDDKPFLGRALASDALASRFQVSNQKVIAELVAGRPLLMGAIGHAVVLVNLRYERTERGSMRILGGTV